MGFYGKKSHSFLRTHKILCGALICQVFFIIYLVRIPLDLPLIFSLNDLINPLFTILSHNSPYEHRRVSG